MTATGRATGAVALASLFGGNNSASAQPQDLNAITATPEQREAFLNLPGRPVVMVNLLKFSRGGAGEADNFQYAAGVTAVLEQFGAERIFDDMCQTTFIGGVEWDRVALVRYPNPRALIEMAQSEAYRAISGNRLSGLEGQVNLAVFET